MNYFIVPQCSISPTASEIQHNGVRLYTRLGTDSYSRFIAAPIKGQEFASTHVNNNVFKVNYYHNTQAHLYNWVIATLPNVGTSKTPAIYRSDTDSSIVALFEVFSNTPNYHGMTYYEAGFADDYELPYGAPVFSTLTDALNAMDDGNWDSTDDPYIQIPSSLPAGGGGTFDFGYSDDIDFPSLPSLSAVSTGFVSLWSPSEDEMLRLSSFMWNADILTTDFWKKLIANPMDLIYGLNLVPLNLSSLGYIDGTGTVVVGLINTGISMSHLSSQWVLFDCGAITIDETWGAYLDYDPYTKLEIYLPFCGVHPLKVDDFMPGTISLKYYIDLLSGTCVAVVKSTKANIHNDTLDSVVYQFMGNCAAQIPVTAQQFADAVRSAINIAASIGSMVATGVGGAAVTSAAKNAGNAVSSIARTASQEISTGASAVENVMNLKPAIERSGAIGSSGALLAVRTPYLILTRPRMARPDKQNVYTGYPSFITETLGDLTGWTIVQAIHLDAIPCTSEELNEIDALLKGGVIF